MKATRTMAMIAAMALMGQSVGPRQDSYRKGSGEAYRQIRKERRHRRQYAQWRNRGGGVRRARREVRRLIAMAKELPCGHPYHTCVTARAGVEHRHRIPHFVVVEHKCRRKMRLKYLPPVSHEVREILPKRSKK